MSAEDWTLSAVRALLSIQSHGALTANEQHMIETARGGLQAVPKDLKRRVVRDMYAELEAQDEH